MLIYTQSQTKESQERRGKRGCPGSQAKESHGPIHVHDERVSRIDHEGERSQVMCLSCYYCVPKMERLLRFSKIKVHRYVPSRCSQTSKTGQGAPGERLLHT